MRSLAALIRAPWVRFCSGGSAASALSSSVTAPPTVQAAVPAMVSAQLPLMAPV
jgi:hypothetical protein